MQVCRDLIWPQHSDLQVRRDLPLSAFLADNQIHTTFCNYIIKHCNLFSVFLPSHHHRVADVSTSFMGIFPNSQLSRSRHLDILMNINCSKQFHLESHQDSKSWWDWMVCRQVKYGSLYSSLFPALLSLHPQTRGARGHEYAHNAVPHYCALTCRLQSEQ